MPAKKTKKKTTRTEEFRVKGEGLVAKVKELVKEGNVRKISIKDKNGKTIVMFPMTIGVVGTVLVPVWAGVGAIAALLTECTISVEKEIPAAKSKPSSKKK
ncbi:DUF4342 domain-containing protein [Candidatus Beckwithbacteria bacterium]|nr:DUF4342 domain-containing protein [Candidatus Beckwithbacteria bacterium]